jgi:lysophospholipase L1-like esterase
MKKVFWITVAFCLTLSRAVFGADPDSNLVINGGFEDGLKGWQTTGDVHLETNSPLDGNISAILGPGAGSLTQRIETRGDNAFTLSARIQSQRTNGWVLTLRFLDKDGRELMRVDSLNDLQRDKKDPRKFEHYMQPHPLTRWVEIVISKDASEGSVLVDQVGLDMPDENAAGLKPVWDLDQAMQPFWLGKTVYNEAVLLFSQDDTPATGRLMFQPTRIISVQGYGLIASYIPGRDYTVEGRTLICSASSRMPQVHAEDLLKFEFAWNVLGSKQVMVTYEHDDTWNHPYPSYVGHGLPHTMEKLKAHEPLTIVAYGDSITHGYGESRLSHILPYLPPWPELFVHRLETIYQDQNILFYNSSQSGATSKWGKEFAERMVASLNPDLVLIAFGQNDFWSIPPNSFATNVADIIQTVRKKNTNAEFLLISTLRYDPAYTTNALYWKRVGEYAKQLKAMTGSGVQFVDMTAISEWVYTAKKPEDCLNDPLHPNDYFARWYAQSLVAALDPISGRAPESPATVRPHPRFRGLIPTPQ